MLLRERILNGPGQAQTSAVARRPHRLTGSHGKTRRTRIPRPPSRRYDDGVRDTPKRVAAARVARACSRRVKADLEYGFDGLDAGLRHTCQWGAHHESVQAMEALSAGDVPSGKAHLRRAIAMIQNAVGFRALPTRVPAGTKGALAAIKTIREAADDLEFERFLTALRKLVMAVQQVE